MLWIALLAAAPATMSPVYLTCEMIEGATPTTVSLAIDEGNQRVTIGLQTGRTVTRPALFSETEVKVQDEEMTWVVSRVDMTIRRTLTFTPDVDRGTCKKASAPPARAF